MNSSTAQLFTSATTHHQAGRYAEAERDYIEALKLDNRDADALRLLAALYVQIGDPTRAVEFFERAHQAQPGNAETLNNLGVALRHCGRLDDAIARYEHAFTLDPQFAQARANLVTAYGERGSELVRAEQWKEAEPYFVKALNLELQNPHLLNYLAVIRREQDCAEEACELFRKALRIKSSYFEAYVNYGNALRDLGRLEEARQCYETALQLRPGSIAAFNNLGTIMQDLARLDEALAYYDEGLRADPHSIDAIGNKACILLALGRYTEGWALNEAVLGVKEKRGPSLFSTRQWDGREFLGQRLLIWCEQGLGDNLQFIRYAALCKERGGQVIVLAPEPLVRLFKNCPYIDEVVAEAVDSDFDYQVAMMSLPHIFGTTLETVPAEIPYIFVDEKTRRKWSSKFADLKNFKVGLVWAGSTREHRADVHLIDKRRSVSLALLKPLLERADTRFYSLQKDKAVAQIDEFGLRDRIVDLMPDVTDMLDTAAIIENLDLVISVDTSVAHLAGALGKPVWVLSRYDACWRWLRNRRDSPWYPTARIFGQPVPGHWESVIESVTKDIDGEISKALSM